MAVNCPAFCGHFLGGNWKRHSEKIFAVVYLVVTVVAVALIVWDMLRTGDDHTIYFWFVAGISVQVAVFVSFWNIFNHLVYYVRPNLQKYIIRILGLIPAHSINCWFSIRYKNSAIYLDTLRNFYQAMVLYSFMSLLLAYLNETVDDLRTVLEKKPVIKSGPPCCCIKAIPNKRLLGRLRAGVLNYVIIHPLVTIVSIIAEITGNYVEGNLVGLWMWLSIIDGLSQVWAMYCLMIFYRATKEELVGLEPVSKMVTVQLTIFGAFFQSLIVFMIIGIVNPELDPSWGFSSVAEFSRFMLDFIICIEMSLSAAAHLYSFPYLVYKRNSAPQNFCRSCMSCCSVKDIAQDIFMHVKRKTFKKTPNLADQIEYDEYDEPEVELDEVAVVREDKPTTQDESLNNRAIIIGSQSVAYHSQNENTSSGESALNHQEVEPEIDLGDDAERERHDSGSYSASGENGLGEAGDEQNDGGDGATAGRGETEASMQVLHLGVEMKEDAATLGDITGIADLGMLNVTTVNDQAIGEPQSSSC